MEIRIAIAVVFSFISNQNNEKITLLKGINELTNYSYTSISDTTLELSIHSEQWTSKKTLRYSVDKNTIVIKDGELWNHYNEDTLRNFKVFVNKDLLEEWNLIKESINHEIHTDKDYNQYSQFTPKNNDSKSKEILMDKITFSIIRKALCGHDVLIQAPYFDN